MAEHIDERISALVDGELSTEECRRLMDEMRDDAAFASSWCNYHLISDALKNNLPTSLSPDFTARVAKALEVEPSIVALPPPARTTPVFVKPTIGFALAASVAAIAYLGLGHDTQQPTVNVAPQLAHVTPAAPQDYPVSKVRGGQWDVEQPAVASKLNDYLASHGQYSVVTGMQPGVLPQVRIVGYERAESAQPLFDATER